MFYYPLDQIVVEDGDLLPFVFTQALESHTSVIQVLILSAIAF
jgi:hypothetical protein